MQRPMHLAQVNVARLRAPFDSPTVREFVTALDPVNRLADHSPGFVWRLQSDAGHSVAPAPYDDPQMIINLSVWESYEALHDFVYRSAHGGFVRRRSRWFEPVAQPSTALWWVPTGDHPTATDGMRRLEHLRAYGPSPQSFTVRRRFMPDGRPVRRGGSGS